ncbi:hypothetical protein [Bradyrhizobium sp. sBnM-33]|uniref:hypothetical protein n=1 Tax=Bradyrhizobium sp. sBnM-33 TaxID=2831780 RepID=UPI001BCEFD18|nr:hypothetical protein [Bradyrhizobium sp. sBnM-33]WOH48222.1 hypothetical protein RX328_29355 [Bradyrhizobium sp. sBnM-33]
MTENRNSDSMQLSARGTAVSDPFADFMTGQLSERHAAEDRRVFRFVYVGLAGLVALAFANLFI